MKKIEQEQRRSLFSGYAILHVSLVLNAMASVFAKFAGLAGNTKDTFFYIALQFMSLAIYALIWQVVLKSMPLATAYANKAICVVWSYVFGVILFGEHITIGKAIGVALVVAGILLVVSDDE